MGHMRAPLRRLRTMLLLGLGVGLTALGVLAYGTDALRGLELDTVDARFAVRGTERPPPELVLVEIDDVTFSDLNLQWPFPRSVHAKVVDRIAQDRPRLIAYDVQFSEPSDSKEDLALAAALADAKPVLLATTEVNRRGQGRFLGSPGIPPDIGARFGQGLLPNDPDGVLRRLPYAVDGVKSFAVAASEMLGRRELDRAKFEEDGAWIDYLGPPGTLPRVPFSRVARGQLPRRFFEDKLVVVGATAPSLQDLHRTSTTGDQEMSGVEIQANAISTVRRGLPLRSAPPALEVALILLLGMAAPLASLRLAPLHALALAVSLGALFTVLVQLAFNAGTVVAFVYPVGTLVVVSVAVLGVHYVTAALERARVRDAFARFVPENVVGELLERADAELRLGGVLREATVMFTDLRGFTSFAEAMLPSRVIEVLNRYLSEMSDAILDHGGTLVAYLGDGIMAVFGAPLEQRDHADRALAAAREMLDERLPRFNDWVRSQALGEGFRMGIGLNSGVVMSGNVGSDRRLEYTAIGDATNTAARIESITKRTPHQLLLAESTRLVLREPPPDLVYVDEFPVIGRHDKVKLWSLSGLPAPRAASVTDSPELRSESEQANGGSNRLAKRKRPSPPGN
jgi:adenylate cyclase